MRSLVCMLVIVVALVGCDDPPTDPAPTPSPRALPEAPPTPSSEPENAVAVQPSEAPSPPSLSVAQARQLRVHLREARTANRAGELEAALSAYRAAAAIDPDGGALCEMGWVLFQSEQVAAARDALTRGLAALPTHDPVPDDFVGPVGACFYNIGRLEEDAGNTSLARRHYARSLAVRPGNRVVTQRLNALASEDSTAVVGGVPACTDGPRAFDLDAWVTEVRALDGPLSTFAAPLRRLGFTNLDGSFIDVMGQGDGDDSPLSATVTRVPLRLGDGAGVAMHVSLDDHLGGQFDGVVVLRSAQSGLCRSGTIAESVDACSTSCLSDDPVFEMRTEQLVAADRDALRITTRTGACSCGSYRGGHHELRFYGVEGQQLVTYAQAVTYDGWYQSPWPPTRSRSADVTLGSGFPRSISVVQTEECEVCGEDLRAQIEDAEGDALEALETELFDACGDSLQTACDAGEERTTLTFQGGRYATH
ncbi:MAG: tetratricopeptide repeat protein [Sandaracinaceae bacterium]